MSNSMFIFYYVSFHCKGEWGSLENGTWNGLLGEVYRREKNLTMNYFTVTYQRAKDFDYSTSFYTEGLVNFQSIC